MNAGEREKLQQNILEIIGPFEWEEDETLFIKTGLKQIIDLIAKEFVSREFACNTAYHCNKIVIDHKELNELRDLFLVLEIPCTVMPKKHDNAIAMVIYFDEDIVSSVISKMANEIYRLKSKLEES